MCSERPLCMWIFDFIAMANVVNINHLNVSYFMWYVRNEVVNIIKVKYLCCVISGAVRGKVSVKINKICGNNGFSGISLSLSFFDLFQKFSQL